MPEVDDKTLSRIKRKAKQLSRSQTGMTYMQWLDRVAHETLGVRHYHEARRLASRGRPQSAPSPLLLYLEACQASYFET